MDWGGGLSFVQRHLMPDTGPNRSAGLARIDKEYKGFEKKGRRGQDQSDAPLMGRATTPEQNAVGEEDDWNSWGRADNAKTKKSGGVKSPTGGNGDWDGWNSSNPDSPLKGSSATSSSSEGPSKRGGSKSKKKKNQEGGSLLIDFGDEWNSKWEDDSWEVVNKKE